jgi:hypothetical protein
LALVTVLVVLSIGLWRSAHTITQEGTFAEYHMGPVDVHYSVPFRADPFLEFIKRGGSHRSTLGPRILEQRPDGFKVDLDLDSDLYGWRAVGIKTD